MDIQAVSFTYQPGVITPKQFTEHCTLYKGYVTKTNEVTHKLKNEPEYAGANATWSHYRGLKKGETYAINGVILHELYFQNLFGCEEATVGAKTKHLMEKYFGSYENWKDDFVACAKSARGWCIFAYEQRTNSCRNILLDTHSDGQICMAYPIIVLDMYEHAYFIDYGTDKGAYINKFISHTAWDVIEKRATVVV